MRKRILFLAIIAYIAMAIYGLVPTTITSETNLDKDDIRIKVHLGRGNSGPVQHIVEDEEKLRESIKDEYPEANSNFVALEGNTPYYAVDDPATLGGFAVYGKVIGVINDDGIIPVFDVVYSDAKIERVFRKGAEANVLIFLIIVLFPVAVVMVITLLKLTITEHKKKKLEQINK